MRKKDPRGDLGRGERQQQVIEALIRKSASLSSIRNYDEVLNSIEEHMSMNLTFGNLLSLHGYASSLESIERLQLQGENTYINTVYYYSLQQESKDNISNALRAHLEIGENDSRQPKTSTAAQESQSLNDTEYE